MNESKKWMLVCSSGNEESIKAMVGKYFYSDSIGLEYLSNGRFDVYNKDKHLEMFRVVEKRRRFRFEVYV